MILEIAISMCLVATPADCRNQYVYTSADGDDEGPISCVLAAPQYAAAVMGAYPEYRLKEWRCKLATEERKESDP
ncbi:MAG: hypothetical protein AB7U75_14905 [Hyphomicrobiaceae bacterium]